jgi:hypothetical protein
MPEGEKLTWLKIFRVWVTMCNVEHSKMTLLLKMARHLDEDHGLPLTTETLLRLTDMEKVLRERVVRRTITQNKCRKRRIDGRYIEKPEKIGEFLYFGILNGILNRSLGM